MPEVDDFLAGLDPAAREAMTRLVAVARATAADLGGELEQGRSYGVPALLWRGKPVLGFKLNKAHVGVVPFSGSAIAAAGEAMAGLDVTKGSVRVPAEEGMSDAAVEALLRARIAEVEASLLG